MRRIAGFPILIALGALLLPACGSIDIEFPAKTKAPGRYAIVSPQKEIFLLDTATGTTWLLIYEDGAARWRPVAASDRGGGAPPAAAPAAPAGSGDNAAR